MRYLLLALFVGTGCATTSFNDQLGAAYVSIDTVADAAYALCGNTVPDGACADGSVISTGEKNQIKRELQAALRGLDLARALKSEGDGELAQMRLDSARGFLRAAQKYLEAREAE